MGWALGFVGFMGFMGFMGSCKSIPTDESEKLKYNAEQIVGSVLTQEYHVLICEGLEYSCVTIGLALVLLVALPPCLLA